MDLVFALFFRKPAGFDRLSAVCGVLVRRVAKDALRELGVFRLTII